MKYFFSVSIFVNCIWALDFGLRFGVSKENKYFENRLVAIACFASALWSAAFGALILQTDTDMAYMCRCIGMIGTFLFLITAQILVGYLSGMPAFWRHLLDGVALTGILVYFPVIKKSEVVYELSDWGMTYYFKSGICNNIYIIYTIAYMITLLSGTIYMVRCSGVKRSQVLGKRFLVVEFIIILGSLLDTIFPMFGYRAIPGSTLTQFYGIVALCYAITKNNRAHINVANMSEFIYDSLSVPVLVYDAKKRIQIMNDAASAFLNVGQEGLETENINICELFDINEEETFSFPGMRRDVDAVCQKNQVYCSLAVNKIHDGYGDIIGYIIIVTDLSERMKTVQELEEAIREADAANQAKSIFLANMSHEIRTPMNVIVSFSELILKMELDRKVREYVEDIRDSSKNLLAVINDILDISKIESGKMELVCEKYYIGSLFQDIFLIIHAQAKNKGLSFHMKVDPEIPNKLFGDRTRIRGILINLLNNAVKYTRQGTISFDTKVLQKDADMVTLEFRVEDTGTGIKEEEQEGLFESFSQADRKVHYGVEGTGLGLAIVKGYVTLMNGNITVKSVYGEGSVFTVVIEQKIVDASLIDKFDGKEDVQAADFCIGDMKMPGVRILVVDDNQINLKVACSTLGYYGFAVDTASGGEEAIRLCRQNRYQLIFMDQMMPQMDGTEAMKRIRKLDSYYDFGGECKIVILTANVVKGIREQLMAEGFDEYLGKPMNFKQLERLFTRFLPSEKIQRHADGTKQAEQARGYADGAKKEPEEGELEILELKEKLPQVDVDSGIIFCGGRLADYLKILQATFRNGEMQLGELRELQRQGDYAGYTIRIHGLKSASLSIGAEYISDMAKEQEMAGKRGDYAYIDAHMEEFHRAYRQLLDQIRLVIGDVPETEPAVRETEKGTLTETDVIQRLKRIGESIEEYDFAGASVLLREIGKGQLPEQYREICAQISQWMDNMETDKISEAIANTVKKKSCG